MTRTVVIGGGFAGVATAGLLARDGHSVTLLEQQDTVGGRSGRWSAEGFSFDTGPSWYLMPEVIDRWFTLMGTSAAEQLDLRRLDPGYRVFFEDHLAEPPTDVVTGHAQELFDSLDPGSSSALRAYLDSGAQVYELAKKHFLYTDFAHPLDLVRPEVLRNLPRLATLLGTSMKNYVARRFPEPRQRQILGYPAVFLGASPGSAPAMYHLMSHLDLTDGVQYPMGGFAALVDAMERLVRAAGVEIVTGATVTGIEVAPEPRSPRSRLAAARARRRTAGTVTGVTYRTAPGTDPDGVVAGAEVTVPADVVVGAADLHHLQTRLLPGPFRAPESRWKRRDPGPSGVLVCLGVRGKLPQLAHHNLLFTADWDENFGRIESGADLAEETSIYVSMTSATDPGTAPEGDENLFILVPSPAALEWGHGGTTAPGVDEPGSAQVERVADAAIAQLARWADIPDLASRIVVRRTYGPEDFAVAVNAWRGSLLGPGHVLTQSAMFRPGVTDRGIRGLFYAGSSVRPGIGVPMCLISSEVVRDAVRESGAR
ncbi:phytoene desaturase family protein [Glutamicibacter protophormiae]|uniref:Dehydrosqualene desaturase n=1 Tax=Kocuria varians TaxID=1272 RepID=A0A7D7Q3J2_KOCVA|nr:MULTISPECIES: phytoene desaturase family protein [Kocuria]WNB88178.1 phytoene desaturase family protein [Glutamicibacter protophormiae]MDN5630923.1 phytoene desaturase family protein [Kocuria sp.]QMS56258.1 Dehydrosqualene desaturase [Kocuria varians]RUP80933.1 phytoene desaturase [Kocuria sp. HSID17590]RUQ04957.1 phytoene desaturase [Kocuria sp. HSID17582]